MLRFLAIIKPGSVTVQTVDELQLLGVRPQLTKGFDDPKAQAAAAVNRDARRLVEDDQAFVFMDNGGFQTLQQTLGNRHWLVALRHANGWDAHDIARLKLVLGRDQKVIDALTGKFRRNLYQPDAGGWGGEICHGANHNNFLWI
jgi:hypothetical protein